MNIAGLFSRPSLEVVYAATGRDFVIEAAISARSVKRHMPDVPVLIVTDQQVECPYFDRVIPTKTGPRGATTEKCAKLSKMQAIRASSAKTILYLDSDTYVMNDLRPTAAYSDYDIAMAHDTWQFSNIYREFNNGLPEVDSPEFLPYFNSGVMFIRRSFATMRLVDLWATNYASDSRIERDQLVLHDLVHRSGLRVLVLPPSFNVRSAEPIQLSGRVNVLHAHAKPPESDWTQSHAFCADFLNQTERNRVFTSHDGHLFWVDEDFSMRDTYLRDHTAKTEREDYLDPQVRFL
ncbi:MAG TPA: putative nucleotide-diphospho-sugar transferase [Kaistia sp.]|nr:putative nucleotide-diphospho-sugar transferase [Kaistia sp.]